MKNELDRRPRAQPVRAPRARPPRPAARHVNSIALTTEEPHKRNLAPRLSYAARLPPPPSPSATPAPASIPALPSRPPARDLLALPYHRPVRPSIADHPTAPQGWVGGQRRRAKRGERDGQAGTQARRGSGGQQTGARRPITVLAVRWSDANPLSADVDPHARLSREAPVQVRRPTRCWDTWRDQSAFHRSAHGMRA